MKITQTILLVSILLLVAAGCANNEPHQVGYYDFEYKSGSPSYSRGRINQYNNNTYTRRTVYSSTVITQNTRADDAIAWDVRQSLQQNPEIVFVVPNMQISANNGTLFLSGPVQSEEQKRQIEVIARRTSGVVAINDQLQVPSPTQGGSLSNERNAQTPGTESNGTSSDTSNVDNAGTSNPASNNTNNSQMYRNSEKENTGQPISPTSRTNAGSQIYQGNGQDQGQSTSNSNQMP